MTFDEFFAQEMQSVQRLVVEPTGALGYGRDLACITDITEDLAETDPDTVQGIGEAMLRVVQTQRGKLADIGDDANYGCDIVSALNRATTDDELRTLESRLRSEWSKDDRIQSLTVKVSFSFATSTLDISARVSPANPDLTAFALVFAVDSTGEVLVKELG